MARVQHWVAGAIAVLALPTLLSAQKPAKPPKPGGAPPNPAIAYELKSASGWTDLMVMDADGRNQTRLLSGGDSTTPSWSPDGEWIGFIRTFVTNPGIYMIRPDGTGLCMIALLHNSALTPLAWSPTRTPSGAYKIIYSERSATGRDLFSVDAQCGADAPQSITSTTTIEEGWPAWSSSGVLASPFYEWRGEDLPGVQGLNLYNVAVDAQGKVTLGTPVNLTASTLDGAAFPAWTEDGQKLLVSHYDGESLDLWLISATDSTNMTRLTNTPTINERSAAWSPDFRKIVFDTGRAIYTVDVSEDGLGVPTLLVQVKRGNLGFPSWRPVF